MEQTNIPEMTFEQASRALDEIVRKMESGQISLEESVSAYETGSKLKEHCLKLLNDAQQRIDKIKPETGETERFGDGQ